MLATPMSRSRRRLTVAAATAGAGVLLVACGSEGVQLSPGNSNYRGAEIFATDCAGCHTLNVAGTQGSASNVRTREYKDGPNFNQRKETVNDVLYAIRNGGFSSGPMPQDIVTGRQADQVARFVAKYSGNEAQRTVQPTQPPVQGAQGQSP
jgi:mono/diheme cytochrome c family protein